MEKYCGDCKYRTFEVNDRFKTYGFCTRKGVKSATFRVDIRRNGLAVKVENKIVNGSIPACLNVQTYYDGKCPYKKESNVIEKVYCKDCKYSDIEDGDRYATCPKAYKGIVQPWDFCDKGIKK